MGKLSEKQLNKRTSIIDAAYELFTSKSVSGTSIDDVVKKAGIAKGTFYLYFKDKYDLMDRIVIHKSMLVFKEALHQLDENSKNDSMTFAQKMIFLTSTMVDYMQNHKELITLVGKKLSSFISVFSTIDDKEMHEQVENLINENEKNGVPKDETVKEIYLIVDMVGSVCCDAIIYEKPYKLDEIKPMLISTINKIIL